MVDKVVKPGSGKLAMTPASTQARPFQCQWHEGCPKSFNRKSDLQRHYRIHTNERPYACDYKPCKKTFIQRSALTVHRRTHTGDKPHKCPYVGCGKCFSDSSSLARHRRIHTNDKPYICKNPRCRKAFCRKTTMTKHFHKEHPMDETDQDEDAEYTDIQDSDEEPALDQDGQDSPDSFDVMSTDGFLKSQTPSIASSTNYSANLWRLPAEMTQPPRHDQLSVRSGSPADMAAYQAAKHMRMPHRAMTDPTLSSVSPSGFNRAKTMPHSVPSADADMNLWGQLPDATSELSHSQGFAMQGLNMTSNGFHPVTTPSRRMSLQPVHDIILDDPQPGQYPKSHPQNFASMQPHRYTSEFRDELPTTPVPSHSVAQLAQAMTSAAQFQPGQFATHDDFHTPVTAAYTLPTQGTLTAYNSALDLLKEYKTDEPWTQMPEAAISWGM